MDIGMIQLGKVGISSNKGTTLQSKSTMNNEMISLGKFGEIFNRIVESEDSKNVSAETVDLGQLEKVLNSQSVEEVLDLLGISQEDGLILPESEDDQAVAIDDLMNLEDLLSILNIDFEELSAMLTELLGGENNLNNIWQLIEQVNNNSSKLLPELFSALDNEHKIPSEQAVQVLKLLKLAQIVGENTDLVHEQAIQVAHLKDFLKTVSQGVQSVAGTRITSNSTAFGMNSEKDFKQLMQQIKKSTVNSSNDLGNIQQTSAGNSRTLTITLPTEKASQAEQLVKEIQALLSRSQISKNQGMMRLQVKLYPENLGSIRVELVQKDGLLNARILATSSATKELLDSQLHQLKNAFLQHNIQLDRIDIQQALQEKDLRDQNLFGNMFRQHQSREDNHNNKKETDEDNEENPSFEDYLILEEV